MAVRPGERESDSLEASAGALEALAGVALASGGTADEREALATLARVAAAAATAEAAVVRTLDETGQWLVARAVWSASPALGAELEGSRFRVEELPPEDVADPADLPPQPARAAARLGASGALLLPLTAGGRTLGSLELLRRGPAFDPGERAQARVAAGQLALALLALRAEDDADRPRLAAEEALRVAGEALAAGTDERAVAEQIARLVAEASGARACLVWLTGPEPDGPPAVAAAYGLDSTVDEAGGVDRVVRALGGARPGFEPLGDGEVSPILPLGRPPVGALELRFAAGEEENVDLARLATFGARAAHALRAGDRARRQQMELERSRALLEVVGQAFAELSLDHALDIGVARVAELLDCDRLAVYLRHEGAVVTAQEKNLAGPHQRLAERLVELALRSQGRADLVVEDVRADPRLEGVREAAIEAGIETVAAVPLAIRDEVIGLLAVYPGRLRRLTPNELTLLRALAGQLAVAVQNAQLHEEARRLGDELEQALTAERQAARTLRALYDVSRSFAQSLRLDATLEALAASAVDSLGVDAAVVHTPSARGELLEPSALEARDGALSASIGALVGRSYPQDIWAGRPGRRPLVLTPANVARIGDAGGALRTMLELGWSAAIVPVDAPSDPHGGPPELLATLTVLSLRPDRSLDQETVDLAATIAGQAALAIDNARLYQQQKVFADTMQRSLLPREHPRLDGLELGDVYASSARLEVGGDVYDYSVLDDGRLAVVLGDVTGHGVEATADMAMTTFVFRSVSREHPEPGDFLRHANEVVVDEVAAGKFVTMVYITIDPATGEVACAAAGHPPPRVVSPDGTVRPLAASGLPLGIEEDQEYEEVRDLLEPGEALVLYTDGVIEARRERELYGEERLDALLADHAGAKPADIAEYVIADCRAFGGDLSDDCAVVVIRRT